MTNDRGTDDTRLRIIEAALRLFGEVGYTRVTTRAIAERAGVNEVTLFRHFGNKKALLLACIRTGNQAGFSHTFQERLTGDYVADIRMMASTPQCCTKCAGWEYPLSREILRGREYSVCKA